jgi:beta-RFAP synthase
MIRVRTPSRLHFGLLSFPVEEESPGRANQPAPRARHFGSVGLMVQEPGILLEAHPAGDWTADGPLAERALAVAKRLIASIPHAEVAPQRLAICQAAPEHAGLGTGTQLAMTVAKVIQLLCPSLKWDGPDLASRTGRGLRSALGVHGFVRGGFLIEAGKHQDEALAPLAGRWDFPEPWRIVLAVPPWGQGLHGARESLAFERLRTAAPAPALTDRLCRLVLLGMLPALAAQDLPAFGESVYEFNAAVGEAFRPVQGGRYANPQIEELVTWARQEKIAGVGQSSWGPAVFALVGDADRAEFLTLRIRERFNLGGEICVTQGCNHGAEVQARIEN